MRFHADGPSIPDILLERRDEGRVVFLCGAGVSQRSGMPDFIELTRQVIDFFDPPPDSEIVRSFEPWLDAQSNANVPLDQIFNLLHQEYGRDEVNARVMERLCVSPDVENAGHEHGLIKRISSSQSDVPQIVTTNFDRLFEAGPEGDALDLHIAPALPALNFGSTMEGITYLHGRLDDRTSKKPDYVLSSADFGRAYLSEGWATRFVRNLLERYTVVLVGYRADDPPVRYLLQGLSHDGRHDRSRLYAFDRGHPEEIEAKWRDRGATAIAYSGHCGLWRTMEAWAERADDPRKWRESIIAKCRQDPKELASHERGQAAHVLRTVPGARLFSVSEPAPHPEWVCVMDASVRSPDRSSGYGAEVFDPAVAYGLDDDVRAVAGEDHKPGHSNDSLLVWREGDDSPHDCHRLGERQAAGPRMVQVETANSVGGLDGRCPAGIQGAAAPRLKINRPLGLAQYRPPSLPWDEILLSEFGLFEVKFPERNGDDLQIPGDVLPQVFGVLEERLATASGLLADIETTYFPTPTCYPDREVDGKCYVGKTAEAMAWFIGLFDRMTALWPELACAHVKTWPATDRFFFRKLKLYALNKADAVGADHAAETVLSFDQEAFWDPEVVRELLFLLVDRWEAYSQENRDRLTDRILAGRDRLPRRSDGEYSVVPDDYPARYARYLELRGCRLSTDRRERLAGLIRGIPRWTDARASSIVAERGSYTGWGGTDETPDALMDLPLPEIVPKAKEDLKRDFGGFTERRPFTGLVKANPRKALAALTVAGKSGDYPQALWEDMIDVLPEEIAPRLRRVFLKRLARLPREAVIELRHPLGRWLERNLAADLEFDRDLGWAVFDHIVDGMVSGEADATESVLGAVRQGGEITKPSRRTYLHAINGPLGKCTEALFRAVPGKKRKAGSLIPDHFRSRFERLLTAPGEGPDHAVSIALGKLHWLMSVDPDWTRERLVPMLAFDNPVSEPAWNGFLQGLLGGAQTLSPPLIAAIKPHLLCLFPRIEGYTWDRGPPAAAARLLGSMRMRHPDEPSGLTRREMRSALREMSDDTRSRFILWLGETGQENRSDWPECIVPFISEHWPMERRYRTSSSIGAWIELLGQTGDDFPCVYEAVKKFRNE